MQFYRDADGTMTPLPKPSIDTGMGLERIGATLMGSHDNYDTDVMRDLIEASAQATGVDPFGEQNVHHRVIADHLRATSFLIADGVVPSNDGRGYILRRVLRRAVRHAWRLGGEGLVTPDLARSTIELLGDWYTELQDKADLIVDVVTNHVGQIFYYDINQNGQPDITTWYATDGSDELDIVCRFADKDGRPASRTSDNILAHAAERLHELVPTDSRNALSAASRTVDSGSRTLNRKFWASATRNSLAASATASAMRDPAARTMRVSRPKSRPYWIVMSGCRAA